MKKLTFTSLLAGLILIVSSCGGGMSKKSYPTNEFLGEIPAIAAQYADVDSALSAESAEYKKNHKDMEDRANFSQKQKEKKNAAKSEREAAIEKAKPSIIGKTVPAVSLAEEYEVVEAKIQDVESTGMVAYAVKIKVVKPLRMVVNQAYVTFQYQDAQGNAITSNGATTIKNENYNKSEDNVGKEFEFIAMMTYKKPKDALKFAKIVILPEKR